MKFIMLTFVEAFLLEVNQVFLRKSFCFSLLRRNLIYPKGSGFVCMACEVLDEYFLKKRE